MQGKGSGLTPCPTDTVSHVPALSISHPHHFTARKSNSDLLVLSGVGAWRERAGDGLLARRVCHRSPCRCHLSHVSQHLAGTKYCSLSIDTAGAQRALKGLYPGQRVFELHFPAGPSPFCGIQLLAVAVVSSMSEFYLSVDLFIKNTCLF